MDLTYYIAKFFLTLCNSSTLLILTAFGFIAFQRKIWGQALILLLFTMILNPSLKYIFHVPLMPHLGKGFAFPSGHMQAAVAFYGWLIVSYYHPLLRSLLLIALTGIGFSLIYFHYHTLFDILGAVSFGGLVLLMYYYAIKIPVIHKNSALIGFLLCALAVPMLLFLSQKYFIPEHSWKAFYGLLGFSTAWQVNLFTRKHRH